MFDRFEINDIFCGYEYFWKCVDLDGNEFEKRTKDELLESDAIFYSAEYDGDRFMKQYVQIGSKKIKVKSVELIKKEPFSQISRHEFGIRFFRGSLLPENRYWGPAREHFEGIVK